MDESQNRDICHGSGPSAEKCSQHPVLDGRTPMTARRRLRLSAATAAALVAPTLFASTALAAASSPSSRHAIANAQPDQVRGARPTGTPRASERAEVRLYLAGRNQADLARAVAAVADP